MKFTITDILWTTVAASLFFLAINNGEFGLVTTFLILALLHLFLLFLVVFGAIAFGERDEQTQARPSVVGWQTTTKMGSLSCICFVVVYCLKAVIV